MEDSINIPLYFIRLKLSTLDQATRATSSTATPAGAVRLRHSSSWSAATTPTCSRAGFRRRNGPAAGTADLIRTSALEGRQSLFMNSRCIPALVPLVFAGLAVAATGAPSPGSHAPELGEVLVTGASPARHCGACPPVITICGRGAVQPLPRKVQWRSKQFESLLANSQEVILNNSGHYTQGSQGAQLAHAARLPDGQSLQDIVPPSCSRASRSLRESTPSASRSMT